MKLILNSIFVSLFFLTVVAGCGQKKVSDTADEVSETPPIENVSKPEDTKKENSVIETITIRDSQDAGNQPGSPSASDPDETAVTYPKPEKIKNYEPLSTEDSWSLVGGVTGDTAYKVFVDPRTIVSDNDLVESWSKLEFEETQRDEDGLSYKQVQINSSIDCKNRTYSYTDSKFYDGLGRLVENQRTPYNPQPIIEGTVSAKIADFVCGYEPGGSQE